MATFGSLVLAPWILFAQMTWSMDAVPVLTAAQPRESETAAGIQDRGEIFADGAERRAREALQATNRQHRTPVLIETIQSLDEAWIADVARRRARQVRPDRLYVLVAADERDVGVIGARRGPASRLTDQQREVIRRAFLGPLQEGRPDEALDRGVRAIGDVLDDDAQSKLGVRHALSSVATLLAALAALLAMRAWARIGRREADAAGPARGHPAVHSRTDPGWPPQLRGLRWIPPPVSSGSDPPP